MWDAAEPPCRELSGGRRRPLSSVVTAENGLDSSKSQLNAASTVAPASHGPHMDALLECVSTLASSIVSSLGGSRWSYTGMHHITLMHPMHRCTVATTLRDCTRSRSRHAALGEILRLLHCAVLSCRAGGLLWSQRRHT